MTREGEPAGLRKGARRPAHQRPRIGAASPLLPAPPTFRGQRTLSDAGLTERGQGVYRFVAGSAKPSEADQGENRILLPE